MFAENEPAVKRSEAVLNDSSGDFYTTETNGKISGNCKHPAALI